VIFNKPSQEKYEDTSFKTSNELFYFPEHRIHFAAALISVFMSAILLIGAIVCLMLVAKESIALRIGMIVLFTSLFAGVVGLLTNSRRAEIFGSTAAYVLSGMLYRY
jgi:hypothetical protein